MAKIELRKSIQALLDEKNDINKQLQRIEDEFKMLHEKLQVQRGEQFGYKEGLATMTQSAQNGPARRVLTNNIAKCEMIIKGVQDDIDRVEKDRVVWASKGKALDKSIKELQNA